MTKGFKKTYEEFLSDARKVHGDETYNYKDVEYSDDECDNDNLYKEFENDKIIKYVLYNCIYVPKKNKWKPYKKADQKSYIDDIVDITRKREKFKH